MIGPCGLGPSGDAATSPNRYETLLSIYGLLAYPAGPEDVRKEVKLALQGVNQA